ncbi:hypothetical protein GmHk_18G051314 [Glycine max]|nr:hypothetical protein GmHk_18G051314 [Glycine max]
MSSPMYLGCKSTPVSHHNSSSTLSNRAGFCNLPTHASFNHLVSSFPSSMWTSEEEDPRL